MNKKLIKLLAGEGGDVITTSLFWDCECDYDYIHPVTQTCCSKCHSISGEQPDSRINEVVLYIQDLYNQGD